MSVSLCRSVAGDVGIMTRGGRICFFSAGKPAALYCYRAALDQDVEHDAGLVHRSTPHTKRQIRPNCREHQGHLASMSRS